MPQKHKIVFLYTELAAYFLSCVDALINSGRAEVHVFRWPLNKEAPFDFKFHPEIKLYERKNFNQVQLQQEVDKINPDLIFCSGWVDKGYKKVCKKYCKFIPVIVGIDNHWTGEFKQRIASALSGILVRKYFNKAWVPGNAQIEFAQKLGFESKDILTGFYSADTNYFNHFYSLYKDEKKNKFPHRFIYVGRYLHFKGIYEMWDAFCELQTENPNDWELWCLGTGAEYEKRKEHPSIKHFGFVQPEEIKNFIRDAGIFVLPSTFEPWGVVVHEFAASGFPIIATEKVGAASEFVVNAENGFIFEAGKKEQLKMCLKKCMSMTDSELNEMGRKSHEQAEKITPEKWAVKLLETLT
jgi:glycosyltransferase involved in cell wall biosynthesis